MNFDEALAYLLSLGHETLAIKLGLRNTELLLAALGNPHQSYHSVQIAGTNGKGSTAVVLDSICRAAGIRTGLFTSPHLVSITERIVIDGVDLSKDDFARHATAVAAAAQKLVDDGQLPALPTFFEHVTTIALLAFKNAGVELAILETGLGGRLDATTVAGAKVVAITTLALDHQEYLGESLAEIAAEKAAIIRRGATAVVSPQTADAMEVILQRCAELAVIPRIVSEQNASIHEATEDGRFTVSFETASAKYENVLLGLRGRHQIVNTQVGLELAESLRNFGYQIPTNSVVRGIENAQHAGRLEILQESPRVLIDGAHNLSGAESLGNYLAEFGSRPMTLVFGAMSDKRLEEIAGVLFPVCERAILTRPDNPRSAAPEYLAKLASRFIAAGDILVTGKSADALQTAREVTPHGGLICVTGSLYLVGEIKAIIGSRYDTNSVASGQYSPGRRMGRLPDHDRDGT